ncbi:MAG TPA: LLM class F420-dependent oxidoreductase [Solirubrobacteraceae bacterium]|jgi:alkanesulfonate monooxygenase|nr:LLM class F420-dependent oxidoreductase [Solirubrobacteraceae bacterium]
MELRVFAEPQEGASYEQQLAAAQLAERLGFGAFFRSDHYARIKPGDELPGPTDSWVTLGALARETSTIQLGTLVTSATFRLPGPLAIAVAQVDAMSGGRVELGLGSGWFEREHDAYGIPFPSVGERFDRLEEQFAILTGLWSAQPGERFSFDGEHYSLHDSPALPKPARAGGPPLIVGGLGARRTPALAARYAAEFNVPFANVERAKQQFERVRSACEQSGRDPDSLVYSHAITLCCATSENELRRRAERVGLDLADLRASAAAGSPAEVAERLAEYAAVGSQRAYLQTIDLDDLDQIELVAAEVMPQLAQL